MSYRLVITPQNGYLHIRVTGENTVQNVRDYLGDVHRECVERNCAQVLIEEHLTGEGLGLPDIYEVVWKGVQRSRDVIHKIAFVDANVDHSFLDMKFAETVAVNGGLNVRVFSTLPEAEAWIQAA